MADVAIEEFVKLKPKMYSLLVDDNIEKKIKRSKLKYCCNKIHMNTNMFCWIKNVWSIW